MQDHHVGSVSAARAVLIGQVVVNGPVFVLLLGPAFVANQVAPENVWLLVSVFVPSFLAAWTYWALAVPRWRVWALERVQDQSDLNRRSVESGIEWPDDHFFSRTEISNAELRAKRESLTQPAGDDS